MFQGYPEHNEYYPCGMQTANSWTRENTTGNSFLYNEGSELNTTSGYYDLPYRTYDPVLGRMNGVDPLASKYASLTPYNYSNNDPVFYTDPSGAEYGVPEWLTRRLDQLPHIDGGGSDGYQGMSALDRSLGSMKLIVKRIDWYTNGIIDDEHFIDSEYSFGMQYQQGELLDVTDKFNRQLEKTEAFFTSMREIYDNLPNPGLNPLAALAERRTLKLSFFKSQVGTNRPFDIKQKGKGFHPSEIGGQQALYNGVTYNFDDFGNINYGVAARALGLTYMEALAGAGYNQTFQTGTPDWGNPEGFFDHRRDTEMIKLGFNMVVPKK
ncbi:MAG: polymorphic toxin type 44 domain-containing protein [Cyclobacteriaceae bacterium]|nr:polymorphic toxin type 44 domain-containing protein [Cyclobacteriaceae bacterium]